MIPIAEATAPKIPNGAKYITYSVNLNITFAVAFNTSSTGLADFPTAQIATAKNKEKITICNKLPSAIAFTTDVGNIPINISENELFGLIVAKCCAACIS